MNIPDILTRTARLLTKNSPTLLTCAGVAGFATTVALAVRATPAAEDIRKSHRWYRDDLEYEDMDQEERKEAVRKDILEEAKELAPLYGPAIGIGALSIACFLVANKVRADRQAAVLAAYSLGEKTFSTYQQKVIERLGQEAHSDILTDTMRDVARDDPAPDGTLGIVDGKMRFYDLVTGRYFYSTREDIIAAEAIVNRSLLTRNIAYATDFYNEIGVEEHCYLADCMGWDITSKDDNERTMEVFFVPMFDDEKNPCTAIRYHAAIFDRSV